MPAQKPRDYKMETARRTKKRLRNHDEEIEDKRTIEYRTKPVTLPTINWTPRNV